MIRVHPLTADRIRELATAEDRSMSSIVQRALEAYEGNPAPITSREPAKTTEVERSDECLHPKPMHTFNGYMRRCDPDKGGCGAKL